MVLGLCGQAACWCLLAGEGNHACALCVLLPSLSKTVPFLAALPATEAGTAALYFGQIVCCMVMCVMLDTLTVDAMNR